MAGYISTPPGDTLGLAVGRRCRFGREGACGYDPCLLCQRGWGRLGSLESGVVLCKCSRKTFCASVLVKPSLVKPIGSLRSGRHQAPTPSAEHPRAQLSSWAPDGHLQCRPWTAPAAVAVAGIAAAGGAAGVVAGESGTSPWSWLSPPAHGAGRRSGGRPQPQLQPSPVGTATDIAAASASAVAVNAAMAAPTAGVAAGCRSRLRLYRGPRKSHRWIRRRADC